MDKKNISYAPILFKKSPEPKMPDMSVPGPKYNYKPLNPGTEILKKGSVRYEGRLPLPCDIRVDRDVAVTMRDGTVLYVDIFRPVDDEAVPAILSYSPFGKEVGVGACTDEGPQGTKLGLTRGCLSGYQKFEGPDPAHWCQYGYAVVNIDSRGINNSQGNACYFGPQDAADGYDLVEWCAGQDWCSGAVTMSGNSWLAITQWYVAAFNPPHLSCIAPWEGHGNMYECEYMRGGIPHPHVTRTDVTGAGFGCEEDLYRMVAEYPLWNSYWEDKKAKFEEITCPAYVVASYTNGCHTQGTFEGWRKISSGEKWLRIHNIQEFPDYYAPENLEDLRKFFDHYCKGADNGWEATPKVRMAILDPGHKDILGRVEEDYPLPRQKLKTFYLNAADNSLAEAVPNREAFLGYDAENSGQFIEDIRENNKHMGPFADPNYVQIPLDLNSRRVSFTKTFEQDTEITGYIGLKLWMEVDGFDDADIFVRIMKLGSDGQPLFHNARSQMYSGPSAKIRLSHRATDPEQSTENEPVLTHLQADKVSPGQIVPVEIALWPTSVLFHAGETLQVLIQSYDDMGPEGYGYPTECGENHGRHIIHTGGRYDSKVILPFA